MKIKLLLSFVMLAIAATAAAQNITVRFTARSNSGQYHRFDTVRVENVTKGWNQAIAYPDTTLTLGSSSGIVTVENTDAMSLKVYPNPFAGTTESLLQLTEDGEVIIRLLRVNGSVVSEYSGFLQAGFYRLGVSLSDPQVAFLSVSTRLGRSVAKMMNKAVGGSDRIVVAPTTMPVFRQSAKAVAAGSFTIGDQMRYTAVSMSGGECKLSTPVIQSQTADGMVTLVFAESTDPTGLVVTTLEVSNVTANSATCGGNVISDGGATVTARGVCWSTLPNPTISNNHTTDGAGTGSFTSNMTGLDAGTTYNVRAYATNNDGTAYGNEIKFMTEPDNPVDPSVCGETRGEWIDLGLPSGLLWYSVNIGATSPEECGCHFAWGETATKELYNWAAHLYAIADEDDFLLALTKYNTSESYGIVDNITTLEAADDVATVTLGNGARIPTKAEWQEFLDNTVAEWTTLNGIDGRMFTAYNGNRIFLPTTGYLSGTANVNGEYSGFYWSSSLSEDQPVNAWFFFFHDGAQYMENGIDRCAGFPVRAVRTRN